MSIQRGIYKSVLTALATAVLSAGALPSLVWADGDFLTPFEPGYPSGGSYDIFVATLPGLGLQIDADGDGFADDRCDANAEAVLQLVANTLRVAQILEYACDALPPVAEDVCFAGLAIASIVDTGFAIAIAQCDFQDGAVDAAEIEAGFENSVKLIDLNTKLYESQLESNLLNCTAVVGLILPEANGGLAEWVETFVQDRIDQYTPVINDFDRIVRAQDNLDQGNIDFAAGLFEDAYRRYCKAYGSLVAGKGRG